MEPINNKTMTEEERSQLAAKLDRDLDKFISGLEKRSYTEGWPEDRWEEVMKFYIKSFRILYILFSMEI